MSDVPIDELLQTLGLTGDLATRGRAILEEAGITNPRKQRLSAAKVEAATAEIDRRLDRLCHACRPRARQDGRELVRVPPGACAACAGSRNRRAIDEMTAACAAGGVRRLVVVGGSPATRRELDELVDGRLELRLVDGTRSPDRRSAQSDIAWADLIAVLGSTQLAHKVSTLYTRDRDARRKLITTSRRGIEAIADEITRSDVVAGARQ